MIRGLVFMVALVGSTAAHALTVVIEEVSPVLIDPSKDPFYVVETPTAGGGAYTIYNNTENLTLAGFGVTNADPAAAAIMIGGFPPDSKFGEAEYSDGVIEIWQAMNFTPTSPEWTDGTDFGGLAPDYSSTAQDLYGTPGAAFGSYPNMNYFETLDAEGLHPGLSASGFGFSDALVASTLVGVAYDYDVVTDQFNLYSFTGGTVSAVPLPAGVWLFASAVLGAGFLARRRKQI